MSMSRPGDMFPQRRADSMGPDGGLPDPAFEPRSDFMFGEGGDDEISNMQRNLEAINGLHQSSGQQQFQAGNGADVHGMSGQFDPAFMQSMSGMDSFILDHGGVSPDSAVWSNGHNLQSRAMQDIVNYRSNSVAHHFGQITPPDDDTSKTLAAPPSRLESTLPTQAPNAKSERARNAANQRHAKAKKARKDSIRKAESPVDGEEDEVEDKRERYREKNRLAAAKCRAKKKVNTEDLEESARAATAQNNRLKAEERELRDLFSSLRDQALAHDASQGCSCHSIHAYNMNKAHETARMTMGFVPGAMPSPTQRSVESGSPSTVGATSRTQSFSSVRPQLARHPARAHSMAGPMGYMSSNSTGELMRHTSTTADVSQPNYAFASATTSTCAQHDALTAGDGNGFQEYLQKTSDHQGGSFS